MSDKTKEFIQAMNKGGQPLASMDLDKESEYATKNQERFAEAFFNNVIDYSKWITSLALAALLLIGTLFNDRSEISNPFFIGSLILLFLSICVSIITFFCVLKFWNRNYDYFHDMTVYYSMLWAIKNDLTIYSPNDCEKQKEKMFKNVTKGVFFTIPRFYTLLLSTQVFFFFFGMVCYIFGVNF
jgi:hypothetical protein